MASARTPPTMDAERDYYLATAIAGLAIRLQFTIFAILVYAVPPEKFELAVELEWAALHSC